MKSLRLRALAWLLTTTALLLAGNALLSWRAANTAAHAAHDGALLAALEAISLRRGGEGALEVVVPPMALAGGSRRFAVLGPGGAVLAGENDLPLPAVTEGAPLLVDRRYRGEAVRIAARRGSPEPGAAPGEGLLVALAEPAAARLALARGLFLAALWPQLVVAAALIAVALLALHWMSADLQRLARALAGREAEDLSPLRETGLPTEFAPLTAAVDGHLNRLSALLEASRRFAADVAHQMRTPLTLLGAQAQYTLREQDPQQVRRMIEGIVRSTRGAQRMCNQMLSLSRIEAQKGAVRDGARLDLARLLRETALDLALLAVEKRIDLAYAGEDGPLPVIGNETLLRELFCNLIDNALRYTPEGGQVAISAEGAGRQARVAITDSGPGIAPPLRERLFLRFYRPLDRGGGEGCGLGLAIVREIALAHGGTVELADGPAGRGLAVRVALPLA